MCLDISVLSYTHGVVSLAIEASDYNNTPNYMKVFDIYVKLVVENSLINKVPYSTPLLYIII